MPKEEEEEEEEEETNRYRPVPSRSFGVDDLVSYGQQETGSSPQDHQDGIQSRGLIPGLLPHSRRPELKGTPPNRNTSVQPTSLQHSELSSQQAVNREGSRVVDETTMTEEGNNRIRNGDSNENNENN
ncbi:unnamed protein product [Arctogadus glacialis]